MSSTAKYKWECPECGDNDKNGKWLAKEHVIYCSNCAGDCGRDVLIRKWLPFDKQAGKHSATSMPLQYAGVIDLKDFTADNIDIRDIALALSNQCRYNGNSVKFYSVAEHSVHISDAAPQGIKLEALLHDAAKAYLGDITAPCKAFLGERYREIETKLEGIIFKKFGMPWPMSPKVKELDLAILDNEKATLFPNDQLKWTHPLSQFSLDIEIKCWAPPIAENAFLKRFWSLWNGH